MIDLLLNPLRDVSHITQNIFSSQVIDIKTFTLIESIPYAFKKEYQPLAKELSKPVGLLKMEFWWISYDRSKIL